MKKFLIIVMSIISFGQTALASGTYCKLDFSDGESDKQAGKILYEYVLKELNKTPEEAKEFARIEPETVKAFEVDLNDDGEKEIVGVVYSTFYLGTAGYSLFILQKQHSGYKNISILVFEPQRKVCILKTKTNGYHDIKLSGSNHNCVQYVAKYKDGMYQWSYKQ